MTVYLGLYLCALFVSALRLCEEAADDMMVADFLAGG